MNFIQRLWKGQGWAFSHQEKQQVIHDHFSLVMVDLPARSGDFNWDALCLPTVNLSSLDDPFSEQEVLAAIKQFPHEKAPGPDGYTGCNFKECWSIINQDLVAVINYFHGALREPQLGKQSKHHPDTIKGWGRRDYGL
jgi:hypothetical protein